MPTKLTGYEKAILADTFGRSPGLQDSIKSSIEKDNYKLLSECIHVLATRSGMQPKFVQDNIFEISEL